MFVFVSRQFVITASTFEKLLYPQFHFILLTRFTRSDANIVFTSSGSPHNWSPQQSWFANDDLM
jgi:hypothetical protein